MKTVQLFIYSAGVILSIVSIAKFISGFGSAAILQTHDPLTGLQFQYLFSTVATIELGVALFCFLSRQIFLATGLIAWLATCLLLYRFFINLIGYSRPCSCLGNFTDVLHISPETANKTMMFVLAYLLIGSYTCLFRLWWQRKKNTLRVAIIK